MDTKIASSIWSNVDFDSAPPPAKLAALWLISNEHVNTLGYAEFNLRRFIFETQLDAEALRGGQQALGKGFVSVGKGYWLRHYIQFQFGRGASLAANNFARAICKLMLNGMEEAMGRLLLTEYPELLTVSDFVCPWVECSWYEALTKGSRASRKHRRGEEQSRGAKQGAQGATLTSAEQIYALYPRKVARAAALKAIGHALRRHSGDSLVTAVTAYAAAVAEYSAAERQFVPHPASWFNGDRFLDDPAQWRRDAGKISTPETAPRTAAPTIALP